jgi:hypothetical protein
MAEGGGIRFVKPKKGEQRDFTFQRMSQELPDIKGAVDWAKASGKKTVQVSDKADEAIHLLDDKDSDSPISLAECKMPPIMVALALEEINVFDAELNKTGLDSPRLDRTAAKIMDGRMFSITASKPGRGMSVVFTSGEYQGMRLDLQKLKTESDTYRIRWETVDKKNREEYFLKKT